MSHRIDQVRSTLLRSVQHVLAGGLSDPRTDGAMITVTDASVSADLRNATLLVSILPEKKQDLCLHALEHASRHIRRKAGELMALSRMPELSFRLDTSLKKQAEVMRAISLAAADRPASNTSPPVDQDHNDGAESEPRS